MLRLSRSFLVFCIVVSCGNAKAQNQDSCRDILQDGIRDQFSNVNVSNLRSNFKTAFCNSNDTTNSGSTNAGLNVTVPLADALLGIGGKFGQDQQQQMRSKYCGSTGSDLSNDDYTAMMKRIASAQVVEAWSVCMHDRAPVPQGVGITSEIDTAGGDDFVFKFRWIAGLNQNSAKVQDFLVSNATCTGTSTRPDAVIGTGWSVVQCTRKNNGPVMVTVSAADQLGATTQKLPAASTPPPPADDLKTKCMNGSATACSSLSNQVRASCGFDAACIGRAQCWSDKSRAITLVKTVCAPGQNQQTCDFQTQNVRRNLDMDCDSF
jgi:hypothetical protein